MFSFIVIFVFFHSRRQVRKLKIFLCRCCHRVSQRAHYYDLVYRCKRTSLSFEENPSISPCSYACLFFSWPLATNTPRKKSQMGKIVFLKSGCFWASLFELKNQISQSDDSVQRREQARDEGSKLWGGKCSKNKQTEWKKFALQNISLRASSESWHCVGGKVVFLAPGPSQNGNQDTKERCAVFMHENALETFFVSCVGSNEGWQSRYEILMSLLNFIQCLMKEDQ